MRLTFCFLIVILAGCTQAKRYTSLCDIPNGYRYDIGSEVTFPAIYMNGGMEWSPQVLDQRCWFGIRADTKDAPQVLQRALNRPGNYNKSALVSGRIERFNGEPWLHITAASQVRVKPPMSEAQENAFFNRMMSERRTWRLAHGTRG